MNNIIKKIMVILVCFVGTKAISIDTYFTMPEEVQDALTLIASLNFMALDTDTLHSICPECALETVTENQPTTFALVIASLSDSEIFFSHRTLQRLEDEINMQIWRISGLIEDEIWVMAYYVLQQYFIDIGYGHYSVPMMHRAVREDGPVISEDSLTPHALETMRDWKLRTLVITNTLVPSSALHIEGCSIILEGNPIKSCMVFKQADNFLKGTICSSTQQHEQGLFISTNGVSEDLQVTPVGNILISGTFIMPSNPVIMLDNALFVHTTGINNTFVGQNAGNLVVTGSDNTAYGAFALHNITSGYANTAAGAYALYSNMTGNNNTACGVRALALNYSGNNNTAMGVDALYSNSVGNDNTAIGMEALYASTAGNRNTAVGYRALYANQGDDNSAFGAYALENNTTGSRNTACGYQALRNNTTGSDNTAVGAFSLVSNTTGIENTACGYRTLSANTIGSFNTAYGYEALMENVTGNNNTACGVQALQYNTTGEDNTACGNYALQNNVTGSRNCAAGHQALMQATDASDCIAIGQEALKNNMGSRNIALGSFALLNNTTGENNVAIGMNAGRSNTTGSNNTFIGYNADCSVGDLNNAMAIGANAVVTTSNTVVLGPETLTAVVPGPDNMVSLGSASVRWKEIWGNGINGPSDERYKKDMHPLDKEKCLLFIEKLEPLEYVLGDEKHYGLSAQRVEAVLQQQGITDFGGVYYSEEADRYGLRYHEFISPLIAAVQKLIDEFEELQVLQQECAT